MIECCKENIYYSKRRKISKKIFALFLSVIFIVFVVFYYNYIVLPTICEISFDYAYAYSTESVNNSVSMVIKDNSEYADLIHIEKNEQGDIVLLRANTSKVNSIVKTVERLSMENLKAFLKKGVKMPFWALSGIKILSGYGNDVVFNILTVSSVECDFDSTFKAVGINQTLHSIYANVKCKVNLEFSLTKKVSVFETKVLISETVLVGKVPEILLSDNLFS